MSVKNDETETDEGRTEIRTVDVCGQTCPDTFVRASVAMDELAPDSRLQVLTDDERSAERIPRNMENHGHHLVCKERENGVWCLTFRKGDTGSPDRWVVVG